MKKSSPWFILLFPVAAPAMIVLDYFGYRIIACVILAALAVSLASYAWSLVGKFRSLRDGMTSLARALFDAGTWSIRHSPYHHTLSGTIGGHRLHYSLLGHDERALCQLFLEAPWEREFLIEAGAEPGALPNGFVAPDGFRSLRGLSRRVSLPGRLLSGLAGSGGPGLVLRKQIDEPFSPAALKRDVEMLLRLAGSPRAGEGR
ncbi:MAG TPA: hypothetical protein PLQ15_08690 [Syntrophales bacterium]|nr:hypothetical protein [Syntrophobacterales bacterium]HQL90664.1 hypothetical protein [Syntrophales bacterium]